jgi:hypothetical protein
MTSSANILVADLTDTYEICALKAHQGNGLKHFYLPLPEAKNSEAITQVGQILQQ